MTCPPPTWACGGLAAGEHRLLAGCRVPGHRAPGRWPGVVPADHL